MQDANQQQKIKVLFLCTGNACRSQMAEGWTWHLKGDWIEPYSAGIETHGLNPIAVKVMKEAGVDITHHISKHVNDLKEVSFDYVVTVCDSASESCPLFSSGGDGPTIIHHSFSDPPRLAQGVSEDKAFDIYRQVRDEIRAYIETLPESLEKEGSLP